MQKKYMKKTIVKNTIRSILIKKIHKLVYKNCQWLLDIFVMCPWKIRKNKSKKVLVQTS